MPMRKLFHTAQSIVPYEKNKRLSSFQITATSRGFTLVEIIVSVGLFAIVMTIAMGGYLSLIRIEQKTRATNDISSNLSFVVDTMARSIRTGDNYNCGAGLLRDCLYGSDNFTFVDRSQNPAVTITYMKYLRNGTYTIVQCSSQACPDPRPLIDPRISINQLLFYTRGMNSFANLDERQPKVIMYISGRILPDGKLGTEPIPFIIETSATQRLLDI
jgi:prepilin-type N-terminal cleavage/methylation domain-containing protein